jgi:DNA-binding NarL/FixJ family response regulator
MKSVKSAHHAAMEIAVVDHHRVVTAVLRAVMAEAPVAVKVVTEVTHARRVVMALQVRAVAHVVMDLQAKVVAARAVTARLDKVDHVVLVIGMTHARSATGLRSHAISKLSSSPKTNPPKLWLTTSVAAGTPSACLMPHASCWLVATASMRASPVPLSALQASS